MADNLHRRWLSAAKSNLFYPTTMKTRIIHTKIWADPWFRTLNTDERLLYFYLLSNDRVNILHLYEISNDVVSRETGISLEKIDTIKEKFVRDGKILTYKYYIYLLNAFKYQEYSGIKNSQQKLRIIYELSTDTLAYFHPHLRETMAEIESDASSVEKDSPSNKKFLNLLEKVNIRLRYLPDKTIQRKDTPTDRGIYTPSDTSQNTEIRIQNTEIRIQNTEIRNQKSESIEQKTEEEEVVRKSHQLEERTSEKNEHNGKTQEYKKPSVGKGHDPDKILTDEQYEAYLNFNAIFNEITGRHYKGDKDSKHHFKDIWSIYDSGDMRRAIENLSKSLFHKPWATPEFITRPANYQKWANMSEEGVEAMNRNYEKENGTKKLANAFKSKGSEYEDFIKKALQEAEATT